MREQVTPEIKAYLKLIDDKYAEAKKQRLSRMSIEWGTWSAEMNREIRAKIESGTHPQEILLKYLFMYWVNRSQLLELHFRRPLFAQAKKRRLAREGTSLVKIILSGNAPSFENFDIKSILRKDLATIG